MLPIAFEAIEVLRISALSCNETKEYRSALAVWNSAG